MQSSAFGIRLPMALAMAGRSELWPTTTTFPTSMHSSPQRSWQRRAAYLCTSRITPAGDVVLVGFGESDPVPFEDLAVVKKALHREQLVEPASAKNPDDPSLLTPLVPFDRVLHLLRGWRCELHDDLNPENTDRAAKLRRLADEVAAGLFGDLDH